MAYADWLTSWLELSHLPNGATLHDQSAAEMLLQAMGRSWAAIHRRGTKLSSEGKTKFQEK